MDKQLISNKSGDETIHGTLTRVRHWEGKQKRQWAVKKHVQVGQQMKVQDKRFVRSGGTDRDNKKMISINESADGTRLGGKNGNK